MSRYHIGVVLVIDRIWADIYEVSFSTTHAPEVLSELSRGLAALGTECKRDGKPYIRSVRGGRQNSTESHHHGMQVTVIMEFTVRSLIGRGT
jgi:hypothetical protein